MIRLVLRNESMGEQVFSAPDVAGLLAQSPRGSMRFRLGGNGLVLENAVHVEALGVEVTTRQDCLPEQERTAAARDAMAERKAARRAATEAAWAAVDFGTLLTQVQARPMRAESIDWLRQTPVEQWGALHVLLTDNADAVLCDGNHRVTVARELGLTSLRAQVRAGDRVIYTGEVGV